LVLVSAAAVGQGGGKACQQPVQAGGGQALVVGGGEPGVQAQAGQVREVAAVEQALVVAPRGGAPLGVAEAWPLPPEVRAQYLAPWRDPARRPPAVISPRQLIKATDYLEEVEANLPRLADPPAFIVWGAKDFAFREPERVRFEAAFPNHRTLVFEDASHFLPEDVGDRIVDAYRTFRREIE
jgi:pimeloyl-ACP methyl ester carboxylesterase